VRYIKQLKVVELVVPQPLLQTTETRTRNWRRSLRKFLPAVIGLAALGFASADAADLAHPYTKAPALAVPAINWTGFYIGAMGGYAKENTSNGLALSGGLAGGTAGYNWQTGKLVLGVEVDAAWTDFGQTATIPGVLSVSSKASDTGTLRGRIGVAFDQFLFYGTGGYAWLDNKITGTALGVSFSDSHVHPGLAAGAGVEVMFMPHWSVKAEYLYRSFSGHTYFATQFPPGLSTGTLNVNSGQFGVNYHF
jgi:outer membrane immunogenic protein